MRIVTANGPTAMAAHLRKRCNPVRIAEVLESLPIAGPKLSSLSHVHDDSEKLDGNRSCVRFGTEERLFSTIRGSGWPTRNSRDQCHRAVADGTE